MKSCPQTTPDSTAAKTYLTAASPPVSHAVALSIGNCRWGGGWGGRGCCGRAGPALVEHEWVDSFLARLGHVGEDAGQRAEELRRQVGALWMSTGDP